MTKINNNVLLAAALSFFFENFVVTRFEEINAKENDAVGTCKFEIAIKISGEILTFRFNYHAEVLGIAGTALKRTVAENWAISKVLAQFPAKFE